MKKFTILIMLLLLFSCQKKEPGLNWEENVPFSEVLDSAGDDYIMIDFVRNNCSWCMRLDDETFKDKEVIDYVNKYMKAVKMHADSTEGKALIEHYNIFGFPTIVVVDSDSNEIDRIIGYLPPKDFKNELIRIKVGKNTLDYYKQKTVETPNDYLMWEKLAEKYEERGDLSSALEVWESVNELEIGNKELIDYKIIELNAHIKNSIEGLEDYVKNNLDSEYTDFAFRNIINIQRKNKDVDGEIITWTKFVHFMELKELNSPAFYNSFAWRMGELDRNLEMALEKIQKGLKHVPLRDSVSLAGYKDTEAEVLWKMGNREEAIKTINECIRLQPEDKYFKDQKKKFMKG